VRLAAVAGETLLCPGKSSLTLPLSLKCEANAQDDAGVAIIDGVDDGSAGGEHGALPVDTARRHDRSVATLSVDHTGTDWTALDVVTVGRRKNGGRLRLRSNQEIETGRRD